MTNDVLPAGAGIGRVALRVPDLEETAAFYEDVVGLDRLDPDAVVDAAPAPATALDSETDRVVLGAAGEPLLLLDAAADAPRRKPAEAGLYHLAIRVPDRPTLGAAIARLRNRDLIDGVADHGVSEAIYCQDPGGNGVEVYVDRPKSAWPVEDGRVEMVTDPLDVEELVDLADESIGGAAADVPSLPEGTTIGHVHLEVTDLDPAAEFYGAALGMSLRQRMGEQALFLAAGEYHHHVGANTWRRRSAPAGESQGLAWFEVVVPSGNALADAGRRLEEAGFAVEPDHDGAVLAATDPDGIGLRLRVDDAIATPTGE